MNISDSLPFLYTAVQVQSERTERKASPQRARIPDSAREFFSIFELKPSFIPEPDDRRLRTWQEQLRTPG